MSEHLRINVEVRREPSGGMVGGPTVSTAEVELDRDDDTICRDDVSRILHSVATGVALLARARPADEEPT